jgi:hypothetical protein
MQRLVSSVVLVLAFSVLSLAATRTFTNNTGGPVNGIRITFSDMVWITSYDKVLFPTQEPAGVASEIAFGSGQLPNLGQFTIAWSETYASVVHFTWLSGSGSASSGSPSVCDSGQTATGGGSQQTASATSLSHAGFSLAYDVDLSNPSSHALSVTLTIHTRGIASLDLSTTRYHPVATPNSPEHIEFGAVPAQGFSVQETERTHGDPHGNVEHEPVWRLSFPEGATISVRYGRTFTRASDGSSNGVTAYLGNDLFLATGARYLILPEMQEGDFWGPAYAGELQGITVHYRLPDDWSMWTPWTALGGATFDPCTYGGSNAASANLSCLVMSTVIAGPPSTLTARCRAVGATEVVLVFSTGMRNLEKTSELMFQAFELAQGLWGEAVDAVYLGAFPTTPYRLYAGEWGNSQGFSANPADLYDDVGMFFHQVYHRWNGFGVFAAQINAGGWANKFYGEAWNCYYQDKLLNELDGIPGKWNYCRQFYDQYLAMGRSADAPVAAANQPDLTSAQQDCRAYSTGALVAYMRDREIQSRTQPRCSLADVVKEIWVKYGHHKSYFNYDDVKAILLRLTGTDFTGFFDAYIFGTERLVIPELR